MSTPLKVLLVEDNVDDLDLMIRELKRGDYQPEVTRVETPEQMRAALASGTWELVISDYHLPEFDAPGALAVLQDSGLDLPFIVLTGSIGEDRATAVMKSGAHDFILKDKLARLNGAIGRALSDAKDRHAHRKARANLRTTNRELATLIDAAPLAIITLDAGGAVQRWNPAAEQLFGWAAHEVLGAPLPTLPPESHLEAYALLAAVLGGRSFPSIESCWRRRDGSLVEISVALAPLRNREGGADGAILLAQDLSTRKHLERQLQQAQKMEIVGRLAGGIAHDFNNLLTVINGRSQLLLNRMPAQDANQRDVGLILETGERAARLTRQLLAFSRRQIFQMRDVDLNLAVGEMSKLLSSILGENIELVLRLDPSAPSIRTDASQFEQVVLNLVVNARDAMPSGGQVLIATARVDAEELRRQDLPAVGLYALLRVSDTGMGMDEHTRAHLFEPFFTTKQQGTGLGLSTVEGIVKQSGGFIRVASTPGHGTTFSLYLPAVVQAQPDDESRSIHLEALQAGTTVLVVEDNGAVRDLICEALTGFGYEVLAAASWTQALEVVEGRHGRIDLLLTDLVMPQISGHEMVERLRPLCPDMKVLFMSGFTEDRLGKHGEVPALHSLLRKPFTPKKLAKSVRSALKGEESGSRRLRVPGVKRPEDPEGAPS